jgi:type II secretory pathway pseudopilin PulG
MNVVLSKSRSKRAFTLIEIMVATTVMIIMVGLVIQITSQVLDAWNRSSDKLSANAEARITLDLLASDLESALFRKDGLRWLEAIQDDVPNPLHGGTFKTTSLQLFTPALDRPATDANGNDVPGDVCAVSYELVYQDPVTGPGGNLQDRVFALHRRLIDPVTTFRSLLGSGNQEDFDGWGNADSVVSEIPRNSTGGNYPPTSDPENYLSSNVVDFQIVFYYDDAGSPKILADPVRFGGIDATVGPGSAINAPIIYADISLTILSDEAMTLLQTGNTAQAGFGNDAQAFVAANSQVFIRRVYFPAEPL